MLREQVSEKFRVRLGHGLFRKLVSNAVLGGTLNQGENIGRSAPFYFSIIVKKILTLFFLSIISLNAIYADITWTLTNNGTLTISGTEIENYSAGEAPWYSQCYAIKKIVIEDGVTHIGDCAFYDCSNLTSVIVPNSVTYIGIDAFNGCYSLNSITIPNSVEWIDNYAFYGCSSLKSITIPSSVTRIGNNAFSKCSNITSIFIPSSVTWIGYEAFADCSSLTSIIVEEGNPIYDSRNNCNAIIETESNYLIAGCMNTVIPNSVTNLYYGAFYGCSGLTSINIPNSVTSIGEWAFYGCI